MAETATLSQVVQPPAARPESADLVVGLGTHNQAATIGELLRSAQIGVARRFPDRRAVLVHADAGSTDGTLDAARTAIGDSAPLVQLTIPAETAPRAAAVRSIFDLAVTLGATACAVVDPELNGGALAPEGVGQLLAPVLEGGHDFVAAYYSRPRHAGAITSSVVYPFTRALYGRRLRFPTGGEFACSPGFIAHCRAQPVWAGGDGSRVATDLWLTHRALCGGFRLSQAHLGARVQVSADGGANLSDVLKAALGALFAEAERNLAVWQKVRGSEPVDLFGTAGPPDSEPGTIDVKRTLDSFRLGQEHLRSVWGAVMRPTTVLEIRKIARLPDAELRIPDPLWARIVYDFALAYHGRAMSRDHLLAAFMPLYLGWLGSFVAEGADADVTETERRIEQLCLRFENEKPYLISGWRWPDRFSP
jgi:hypothetical protein